MTTTFDLVLICGRRPELLARTLASFQERVFCNFFFANVIANIDPFCGTVADGEMCRDLILSTFPAAHIIMPEQPGFCAAVIRVWQRTNSDIVLHLEDDWLALEPITPERVVPELTGDVKSLTMMTATKNTRNKAFQTCRRRVRNAEGVEEDNFLNAFSTSPAFFSGDFLRHAAGLMDPGFDPEKQFFRSLNPALETYAFQYRCKFLFGTESIFLIEDIGREWRDGQKLGKWLVKGQSVWAPLE